jgi:hypothetical protein
MRQRPPVEVGAGHLVRTMAWALFMLVQITFIVGALYLSSWLLVPFVIGVLTAPLLMNRIVCPNCATPVTYQGDVAGFRIKGGFVHRTCRQCGWDLDQLKG